MWRVYIPEGLYKYWPLLISVLGIGALTVGNGLIATGLFTYALLILLARTFT